MKALLIIPILFCLQDTIPVSTPPTVFFNTKDIIVTPCGILQDTTKLKEQKMFFEKKTNVQRAVDINTKLDSLILILEAKKDTTNGRH